MLITAKDIDNNATNPINEANPLSADCADA